VVEREEVGGNGFRNFIGASLNYQTLYFF